MCSNAGFIFFGTMLRSLAASDFEGEASAVTHAAERVGTPRFLLASTDKEECATLRRAENGVPLSVLNAVAGVILDSAPSRLTPDIAARRACLYSLYSARKS